MTFSSEHTTERRCICESVWHPDQRKRGQTCWDAGISHHGTESSSRWRREENDRDEGGGKSEVRETSERERGRD